MKKGNKVALAIFDSRNELEFGVSSLKGAGFRSEDVSVLMPQGDATFAHEKGTKAPEGATVGSGTGALIGGAFGWLVGVGAIAAFPALGPLVAAGPILSALTGAAVGGAVGSLTGALVGLGIPEYEAKRYEGFIQKGGLLLSVHADDKAWLDKACEILKAAGGHDISTTTEVKAKSSDSDVGKNTPPPSAEAVAPTRPTYL